MAEAVCLFVAANFRAVGRKKTLQIGPLRSLYMEGNGFPYK